MNGDTCIYRHIYREHSQAYKQKEQLEEDLNMCRYFTARGACLKGSACVYKHVQSERANYELQQLDQASEEPKVCRYFASKGSCLKGNTCIYRHAGNMKVSHEQQEQECRFALVGSCVQGEACCFKHYQSGPPSAKAVPCDKLSIAASSDTLEASVRSFLLYL
jgi:hypothetical protein